MSRGPWSDGGPPLRIPAAGRQEAGVRCPDPIAVQSLAWAPTWPAAPPSLPPSSSAGAVPPAPCPAAAAPGRPPTAAGWSRGSGRPCAGAGLSWLRLLAGQQGPWGHGRAPAEPQDQPWAQGPGGARLAGWDRVWSPGSCSPLSADPSPDPQERMQGLRARGPSKPSFLGHKWSADRGSAAQDRASRGLHPGGSSLLSPPPCTLASPTPF